MWQLQTQNLNLGTFEPKVVELTDLLDSSTFPQVISLLIQITSNSEIEKISCKLAQRSQRKVQNLSLEKIWRERGHSEKGRVRHLQNGPQFHQFCKSLFRLKMTKEIHNADNQVGITCGAIEEASRSSKAINEHVVIKFRDKNAVTARFCDKNDVFDFYDKLS